MTVIAVRQREKPGYEGQFVELTLRGKFGHTFSVMADDEWNLSARKVS